MKTVERITQPPSLVSSKLGSLQFTDQPSITMDHLPTAQARLLFFCLLFFFYYSSAFNTIQPSLSWGKLVGAGVECHLAAWIINCRPVCEASLLCVWCGDMQHRGPQVLYLFFWPVHIRVQTQDKQLSPPEVLWYLISLEVYQKGTNRNTGNPLHINSNSAKEMVIDFCRKKPQTTLVNIWGWTLGLLGYILDY